MVFDYFSFARAKKNQEDLEKKNPQNPVLKHEDEQFLERVTTQEGPAAPLPPSVIKDDGTEQLTESKELQEAGEAAGSVALPETSEAEDATLAKAPASESTTESAATSPKRTWGSYIPSIPSVPRWRGKAAEKAPESTSEETSKDSGDQQSSKEAAEPTKDTPTDATTAADAPAAKVDDETDNEEHEKVDEKVESDLPPGVKITENVKLDEAKKEQDVREVSVLLDRLNLSSINNRVFSFSEKSQKLYEDFTVVLKDMINGAPTAYEDMEKLLKDNEAHLSEMFNNMPPFIQTLVKSLPAKFGGSLGPEILAAASEKPGADMKARMAAASKSQSPPAGSSNKKKRNVPSVKGLANEQGAIAGMLRSIVAFLKTRFPAFVTGTNVIMSLAVFILLFVFWYCHKRGKETRLLREKDANASASEMSDVESGLEESQELTPDESEANEVEDGEEIETPSAAREEAEKDAQAILDQPEPAEVPLPVKEEEKELHG